MEKGREQPPVQKLEKLAELLVIKPFQKEAAITYGNIRSNLEKKEWLLNDI